MVTERVGSLAWLRKRLGEADTDLLLEMAEAVAEVLMKSARCDASRKRTGAKARSLRDDILFQKERPGGSHRPASTWSTCPFL